MAQCSRAFQQGVRDRAGLQSGESFWLVSVLGGWQAGRNMCRRPKNKCYASIKCCDVPETDSACAGRRVQGALEGRLGGYPARALAQMHTARVTLPAAVAAVLRAEPNWSRRPWRASTTGTSTTCAPPRACAASRHRCLAILHSALLMPYHPLHARELRFVTVSGC